MSWYSDERFLAGVTHKCGKCHYAGDCYCDELEEVDEE